MSASTIIDGTSLENYEGIVDRSYQNTESEKISLVVKQVGDATDPKGFTAIGHGYGPLDIDVTSLTIDSQVGAGIYALGVNHSIAASDFIKISSSYEDAVYATSHAVINLEDADSLEVHATSVAGGDNGCYGANAVIVSPHGYININNINNVKLTSDGMGAVAIASEVGGEAGITIENADVVTIESTINNQIHGKTIYDNDQRLRYNNAVSVEKKGTLTINANTVNISVTDKAHNGDYGAVHAIRSLENSKISLNANEINVTGNVDIDGELNLNGNLIFKGKDADVSTLTGDKAQITLTDKNQTFKITTNSNSALTIAADSSVAATIDALKGMTNVATGEDGINWFIDGSNGGYDISLDAAGNEVKVISKGTQTAIRGGQISGRLAVLGMKNDVRKRLGDIRHVDAEQGAWVRYEGGRMSASGFSNKLNTLQIGYDTKAIAEDVRLGAAVSYTRNDAELVSGAADADMYTLTLYGTWMGDNGMYADVIGRVANIKNDITIFGTSNNYSGDLNNTIYSVSGEFGQRFDIAKTFFVEPQVEVIYSYVTSDSMKLDSQKYKYDSVDSLIGRAGMVFGWNCPNDKGHVYFRASALKEFKGDSKLTTSVDSFKTDGKDTWAELGLGAQYNVNKNIHVWADVERTQGAEVNEDFRGTLGVRVSF